MQGHSSEFEAVIKKSHTAVTGAEVIRDGKVAVILEPHAGSVTADRTAAQMRTFEFEVIDRDGTLTPTSMTSVIAPFGAYVQVKRGVRLRGQATGSALYPISNSWTPQTPTGQMVSVKIDPGDGSITLGP